jgi:DNA-binding Xre family transcriptional regulator
MPAVHPHESSAEAAALQPPATIPRVPPRATVVLVPALRYWRTRRALLQRELAEQAGVDRATVQRAEASEQPRAIRLDVVRKLAEALQVEPSDLMGEPPA